MGYIWIIRERVFSVMYLPTHHIHKFPGLQGHASATTKHCPWEFSEFPVEEHNAGWVCEFDSYGISQIKPRAGQNTKYRFPAHPPSSHA